jgi:hypothetical protein
MTAESLETSLHPMLQGLPSEQQSKIMHAARPLFSMCHLVCADPRLHTHPPANLLLEELPELEGLAPEMAGASDDDSARINAAMIAAPLLTEASSTQLTALQKSLGREIARVQKRLCEKGGLFGLLRKRMRWSPSIQNRHGGLISEAENAFEAVDRDADTVDRDADTSPPRRLTSDLCFLLRHKLLTRLEGMLKDAIPPPRKITDKAERRRADHERQKMKTAIVDSIDPLLQTHSLVRDLESVTQRVPIGILFGGLVDSLVSALQTSGTLVFPSPTPDAGELIRAISTLDARVIDRDVFTAAEEALTTADPYTTEVLLAALHHLEYTSMEARRSSPGCFGFSEPDIVRHLNRGSYAGADPNREASPTAEAEKQRVRRTLQYLRRAGLAIHDRRHWTPLPKLRTDSKRQILWTINPLLVLLPQINARRSATISLEHASGEMPSRKDRPKPSRRNRGTRRRT